MKRSVAVPRIRWQNLTKENATKLSEMIKPEQSQKQVEDAHTMWEVAVECNKRLAREILGTLGGGSGRMKGAWLQNEKVKRMPKRNNKHTLV